MNNKKNGDIKALTGLRFIAALFVCMAHILPKFWLATPIDIARLSAEGMTLFFVLSGFVIHYNYSHSISTNKGLGLYNFFVARFARLYPLFIIGFFAEYYLQRGFHFNSSFWYSIPFYLTMTQSWVFFIIKKNALIYQFHHLASVAWSVSTEWFFYLAYPIICYALFYMRRLPTRLLMILTISVIMVSAVYIATMHFNDINQYGIDHFGPIADASVNSQDSFYRWLIYFSPYYRIAEFMVGCLTAAIFMQLSHDKPGKTENLIGSSALIFFIVSAALLHMAIFNASGRFGWMITLHQSFGFALPMGGIIFCAARYQNFVSRFLSLPVILLGGEISYSLYLLHLSIATHFHHLYFALPAVFLGAYLSYRIIEVPFRKRLRDSLIIKSQPVELKPVLL
jgi:peptidoglycan/LPS O-acetylase OafA/YrhL